MPLNRALGIGGPHAAGLLSGAPDWAYALGVGISAGLCEEWARYAVMRFGLKRPEERGGSQAILFGVGHGGIEAMILSGLPALGGVSMLIAHFGNFELGPAQREGLRTRNSARNCAKNIGGSDSVSSGETASPTCTPGLG